MTKSLCSCSSSSCYSSCCESDDDDCESYEEQRNEQRCVKRHYEKNGKKYVCYCYECINKQKHKHRQSNSKSRSRDKKVIVKIEKQPPKATTQKKNEPQQAKTTQKKAEPQPAVNKKKSMTFILKLNKNARKQLANNKENSLCDDTSKLHQEKSYKDKINDWDTNAGDDEDDDDDDDDDPSDTGLLNYDASPIRESPIIENKRTVVNNVDGDDLGCTRWCNTKNVQYNLAHDRNLDFVYPFKSDPCPKHEIHVEEMRKCKEFLKERNLQDKKEFDILPGIGPVYNKRLQKRIGSVFELVDTARRMDKTNFKALLKCYANVSCYYGEMVYNACMEYVKNHNAAFT